MASVSFGLGKALVDWAKGPVTDWLARRRANNRANQGEDLARQGSLEYLVKVELAKLATSGKLPSELQSDQFRKWVLQSDNAELFLEVLIAEAGNQPELARQAEERLAADYERIVGDTRKLAAGPIALVVSGVYGQLQATEAGSRALRTALDTRNAANLHRLTHPDSPGFPTDADLVRARALASKLLEVGKKSWKMPPFVAPLNLEVHEKQEGEEPRPTNADELVSVVTEGGSLLLCGEGGVGKTTLLLDLCSACMNERYRRIPLYVDAAVWARANPNLLEYIANTPSAQLHGVTSIELAKLAEAGYLTIMLNGWNEIPASRKVVCRDSFNQLTAAVGAINVVVASRTSNDAASVRVAMRVEVHGLTWEGQSAVIRKELGEDGATPLLELLAKDTRLRYAARSPIILRGLIEQARKGAIASPSVFDLLNAVVQVIEEDDQRALVLNEGPVFGLQRHYLEELACKLNSRQAIDLSHEETLPVISSAGTQLVKRGLLGSLPQPATVLNVLGSHHILHIEDGVVRFAHQRFQEYFAAARLYRECVEGADPPGLLSAAVNQPAWGDALMLVAGKLKREKDAVGRVRLVKAAVGLDLGFACDLAGICALSDADDSELHSYLVARVIELTESPLREAQDLGVACQIASGFEAFAEKLWLHLESTDRQTRLHTYRLNGSGISLAQLGSGAEERVGGWPSERRVEFMHELAKNADNYDFVVRMARTAPDRAVRAAAISALFWHFPASEAPIQAWLDAPIEVQTEQNLLNYVEYAQEQGHAGEAVRERLRAIASSDTSDNAQLRLALVFPNEVGLRALDAVFARLGNVEHHGNDAPLVSIAQANAPERLLSLAKELVLGVRATPEWVSAYLKGAPTEVRTTLFEQAWSALHGEGFKNRSAKVVGPLADRQQTERSVVEWLRYSLDRREKRTDAEHEMDRQLGYLLANAPGNDLLHVVMERGKSASYDEAVLLVELVLTRVGSDDGRESKPDQWLPSTDEVRRLVALFRQKTEVAEVRQDKVFVYLSCIASRVEPAEFGALILEACRRHLEAWTTYRELLNHALKTPLSPRLNNPSLGNYVISALAKCGLDVLPDLIKLMAHPSAMELIPDAIGRIVSLPWASKRDRLFSSVATDIQEGAQRRQLGRSLRQPGDTFQQTTDEAARVLGQKLTELVAELLEEQSKAEKWNGRQAEYRIRRLVGIVANMPSFEVVVPLNRALASGLADVWGAVDALRGLVRQGLFITEAEVVGQLEALYQETASAEWLDEQTRYVMAEFSALLYCVSPPSILTKPLSHYLVLWRKFSYLSEVIRNLGAMRSEAAWPSLLEMARELAAKGQPPEEISFALVSALTPGHLTEFFALVADRTLLSWCGNAWTMKRIAPSVAAVIGEDPRYIEAFLEACRCAKSPAADALAGEVLSHAKGSEARCQRFLLDAIDAERVADSNVPAYGMLLAMFKLNVPMSGEGQYEIYPNASNELRAQLYARAKGAGPAAATCRRLLASVECQRREEGRPIDELRHPDPNDGLAWTDALAIKP